MGMVRMGRRIPMLGRIAALRAALAWMCRGREEGKMGGKERGK